MARYFFHLVCGTEVLADDEGRSLRSIAAAVVAATRDARSIMSADALDGRIDLDQEIRVADGSGATLRSVRFADAIEVVFPAH